jgi:hypothetical protein
LPRKRAATPGAHLKGHVRNGSQWSRLEADEDVEEGTDHGVQRCHGEVPGQRHLRGGGDRTRARARQMQTREATAMSQGTGPATASQKETCP